uniref:Protein sprint n=1 Tax=Ascaris suum TaxID=6253 RepID=F1KR34_ASCSU
MEKYVPAEYTSSPIVDILASTAKELRPTPSPPSFGITSTNRFNVHSSRNAVAKYPHREINSTNQKTAGTDEEQDDKAQGSSTAEKSSVSLLEQIVRSHPIWYLQHVGRSGAVHLLRPMEEGVFIVRSSSKPHAMALSIRLRGRHGTDTDHYLIETDKRNRCVHLQSSPYRFKSLPLLIEHYCLQSEELQVHLTLPAAILSCRSSMQLQSLALMGQDFWISEAAQQRRDSWHSSHTTTLTSNPVVHSKEDPMEATNTCALSKGQTRFGDDCVPRTSASANERVAADTSTLSSTSTQHSDGSTDGSRVVTTVRKSFLKNFRFIGSSSPLKEKSALARAEQWRAMNSSADCDFLNPYPQSKLSGSQSAYAFTRNERDKQTQVSIAGEWPNAVPSLRTFKPKMSFTVTAKENVPENVRRLNGLNLHSNVGTKPAIKPKPLALRRERSDLTFSSARRLAYYAENHSPRSLSAQRRALVPPSECFDGNALRGCLEELKRKREEASMSSLKTSQNGLLRRSSPKFPPAISHANDADSPKFSVALKAHASGYTPKGQHRLSVPDLAELTHGKSMNGASNGVATSAKALTSRLGRSPATGELQAINEGLVTPVVRRKQYMREVPLTGASPAKYSPSDSTMRTFAHENVAKEASVRVADQSDGNTKGIVTEQVFTKRSFSERYRDRVANADGDCTATVHARAWRPAWKYCAQKRDFPCSIARSNAQCASRSIASTRSAFPNKPNAAWSAINNELKSRQKIAKVRPTPQIPTQRSKDLTLGSDSPTCRSPLTPAAISGKTPSTSRAMQPQPSTSSTVTTHQTMDRSSPNPVPRRISEYAHLSDCVEVQQHVGRCEPQAPQSVKEDDSVSVAGTVFNEPWDSNVWENLLDLAHYGAEKPSTLKRQHTDVAMPSCLEEPIVEEEFDEEIACSLGTSSEGDDDRGHKSIASDESGEYGTTLRRRNNYCHDVTTIAQLQSRREATVVDHLEDHVIGDVVHSSTNDVGSKTSVCANRKEVCNSSLNVNNAGTLSDGTATICTRRTLNSHSLPRTHPHCYMHENPLFESLDDIPSSIRAISPVISPPRLKSSFCVDPGTKIQEYVERLSAEENTVFGATLRRFIECTVEGEESDPQVVIRNVRQFLNGIKNYLVKHGEGELHELIESERTRLNANEFLNIDAILEAVLHKIVLCPVKPHLYHLMVREHSKDGSLQTLSENLAYVRTLSPEQLGFGVHYKFTPPNAQKMDMIKICMRKMQYHYSPLKKLDNLLRVVFLAVGDYQPASSNCSTPDVQTDNPITGDVSKVKNLPAADELVRWLVYLLARTSTVGCEVEAWYMWELLPKQLLTTGDSSYYLIALFSAVDILKNTESIRKLACVESSVQQDDGCCSSSVGSSSPVLSGSDAFIRVAIPDELDGSIRYHTFPGSAQMTAGKLCRVIAHQFGITNPEDHGLYLLVDGFETCLLSNECPDAIRHQLQQAHKAYLFAYKRHEAKIAWPKAAISCISRC